MFLRVLDTEHSQASVFFAQESGAVQSVKIADKVCVYSVPVARAMGQDARQAGGLWQCQSTQKGASRACHIKQFSNSLTQMLN